MTEEEKKRQKELEKQERLQARQEELEKIKGLGFGAKIQYFWDYYKIVLVIIVVIIFIIYLIFNVIQGLRTDRLLYVCFLNCDELDADTEGLKAGYIEARGGVDNMQEITFDSSVVVNPNSNGTGQQDVASSIKITSYIGSGSMDAFLTPSYVTEFEQKGGIYMPLEDLLTEEEIRELGENGCLYYASEPETDADGAIVMQTELQDAFSTEAEMKTSSGDAETAAGTSGISGSAGTESGAPGTAETESGASGTAGTESGTSGTAGNESGAADSAETEADSANTAGQVTEYALNTEPGNGMHIYAVRVDQAGVIDKYRIYADRQVWFSVIGNAPHVEETMNLLHFLLGEDATVTEK